MRDRKFTPNDNGSVIRMLSGKYAECNRGRNRILLGAVILSIVTLTMVFGISYGRIRGEELRAIRQAGTAASGMSPYADSSQYALVRSLEYISEAGRSVTVGEAREADAQTAGEKSETENPEKEKSGAAEEAEEPGTLCVVRWMDRNAWEEMASPAYTEIRGSYPEQEQEIMLSLRALKSLGIDRPEQGMQISLKVFIGLFRTETETFRLSGWFTDYSEDTEEASPGYISRAKLENWGYDPDEEANILFRQSDGMDWRETEERLYEDVPMKDSAQKITVSDTYAYEAVNEMTGGYGMAAFGALVILSGMFFLIHNVMQISMMGDVRQMGFLNVIGTTEKQIRRIYYGQLFRVLIPGVISGAILSAGALLFLLPKVLGDQYLNQYGGAEGLQIFRPGILAMSVLFAVLLLFVSSAGVIRKAARESCAETIHYTGLEKKRRSRKSSEKKTRGRKYRRRSPGGEILFMAWQNLTRFRGRFVLTVLSLFLGAEAFLGAVVITDGSDYAHVIEQRPDFLIAGQFGNPGQSGYGKEYQSRDAGEDPMLTEGDNIFLLYDNDYDEFSPISREVREQLLGLDGVEKDRSYVMEGAYMIATLSRKGIRPVVTDPDILITEEEPEKGSVGYLYSENTEWVENSDVDVIQILSDQEIWELKSYAEKNSLPVDMDSLENGTGVLILHDHRLSREQEKMAEESVGEPVYFTALCSREEALERNRTIRDEGGYEEDYKGESSEIFRLSGYLDNRGKDFPKIRQTWHGSEANLYFLISEKGFEKLPTEKKTLYMELNVEQEKEPRIKSQITEIISRENERRAGMTGTGFDEDTGEAGIFCISRSDLMAEAAAQIRGSRLILGSISVMLLVAGFTNYLNVMITGILSRRRELKVMESIGMTGKQKRAMFLAEGGCYCLITAALMLTAGSGILYLIRRYMEERLSYFQYQYPFVWTFILLAGLTGICLTVPEAMARKRNR